MTTPCPALGFQVVMELADAVAAESLRHEWLALLEGRGLACAGHLATGRRELTVTSEAAQATESDRAAVRAWLESRAELRAWRVGEIEDFS